MRIYHNSRHYKIINFFLSPSLFTFLRASFVITRLEKNTQKIDEDVKCAKKNTCVSIQGGLLECQRISIV